jgi:hypothetical protein
MTGTVRKAAFATLCTALLAATAVAAPQDFNGASSYAPASKWDAPIFRQFAFVEGRVTQYHVLQPEAFVMDFHRSRIYQFPECATLAPVLGGHTHAPGDGGFQGPHDAPTREIVDVVLSTACAVQPASEGEVWALASATVATGLFVNAPVVPPQYADWPDERLFNGPPFRPRVLGYQAGAEVRFLTYEASWMPTWVGANFPTEDADVFVISYGAMFRPGFTILNVAAGTPLDFGRVDTTTVPPTVHQGTFDKYSPMWRANCIVDALDQKCGISVNLQVPGYYQCRSIAACTSMTNAQTGLRVLTIPANTFTHINCPMVAVDLNLDNYIAPEEELLFPDLWVNGPVLVV